METEVKPKTWESTTLKKLMDELILTDSRFTGMSRYLANVRIFWSFAIPTACAGHGFIFFNPDFYDKIPEETRKTVLAHEGWHLILKHLQRGKGCDPRIHNQACDHVINLNLEMDGFTFDGTEPWKDPKYKGKSTEQIYNELWKAQKQSPKTVAELSGDKDPYIPAELIEELVEEMAAINQITLDEQIEANEKLVEMHGKQAGQTAGNSGIVLDMTKNTVIIQGSTYEEIFKPYLTDPLHMRKRTFMRPNRRTHKVGNKLILPGRLPKPKKENRLSHLVYALDVSGSISQKQAQQFHDSIRTLKELLNPSFLTVLFFDTRIVHEQTFSDKQPYGKIQVRAGGGTDLKDVYKRVGQLNPEALVIFTDLAVTIPAQPKWKTIWLVPFLGVNIPKNIYGNVYLIPEDK